MSKLPEQKFDFLREYILQVLKDNGFDKLSQKNKDTYLLQFQLEAERRLGIVLMPYLDDKAGNEFADLLENANTKAGDWLAFWHQKVPNFDEVIKKTLADFAIEVRQAFAE